MLRPDIRERGSLYKWSPRDSAEARKLYAVPREINEIRKGGNTRVPPCFCNNFLHGPAQTQVFLCSIASRETASATTSSFRGLPKSAPIRITEEQRKVNHDLEGPFHHVIYQGTSSSRVEDEKLKRSTVVSADKPLTACARCFPRRRTSPPIPAPPARCQTRRGGTNADR